jgi:hypothetical protein
LYGLAGRQRQQNMSHATVIKQEDVVGPTHSMLQHMLGQKECGFPHEQGVTTCQAGLKNTAKLPQLPGAQMDSLHDSHTLPQAPLPTESGGACMGLYYKNTEYQAPPCGTALEPFVAPFAVHKPSGSAQQADPSAGCDSTIAGSMMEGRCASHAFATRAQCA